ncbi:MAG: AEC family transporter [Clostridia bacterium]|nr:AEC family transporter [Clostridia bacterium]
MQIALKLIYNVALLFLMMVPGVLMKKCRLCDDSFGKGISNLVLYIAQPALTFVAYLRPYDEQILINSAYVFVFSVLLHALFAVVAMNFFKKAPDSMRRMLRFATVFSNVAFMGIPLIAAVLEADYPGSTVYALIYSITFNVFLWSLGVKICTDHADRDHDGIDDHVEYKHNTPIWKAFVHPTTIASAIGLVFFILPIEGYVPALAEEAFVMLKNLVAPLSMVVIGLRLADMSFKGVIKDVNMYIFIALRHVALPLIALGLVKLVGLVISIDPAVEMVIVILAAAPAATSATMFAEKYDCDSMYVSRLVTVSTILSIVTIPLILLLV